MLQLIKILLIVCEFFQSLVVKRKVAERDAKVEAIRNDPAGEFINEFGGVHGGAKPEADMSGSQAGVEVCKKE